MLDSQPIKCCRWHATKCITDCFMERAAWARYINIKPREDITGKCLYILRVLLLMEFGFNTDLWVTSDLFVTTYICFTADHYVTSAYCLTTEFCVT